MLNERFDRKNKELVDYARKSKVFMYEIANELGVYATNFSHEMRHKDLTETTKEVIRKAIDDIAARKAAV